MASREQSHRNRILGFVFVFCVALAGDATAQQLQVEPKEGLADESLSISAKGLPAHSPVTIRATMKDSQGRVWQSFAGFYADIRGTLDLSSQAPIHGSYTGINVNGLIQSMQLPGDAYGRSRFSSEWSARYAIQFDLESHGRIINTQTVNRKFASSGVVAEDVREDGLIAKLFLPGTTAKVPAVLVLGGSEGGLGEQELGALLASRGFVALTLAYFGAEHLPASLSNIPLEYFDKALDFLQRQSPVQRDRIGILGTSKGAEAGLLVASRNPVPRVVVAYAPSAYVWSCICEENGQSSWSVHGKPVPFIPFQDDPTYAPPDGFPLRITVNYLYSLHQQVGLKETTIPVERIRGPIMLISGKDDQLWPSYPMANAIIDRRHRLTKFRDLHLAYANAGHVIGKAILPVGSTAVANGHIETGGTLYGDAAAQQDSWPRVIEFLRKALGK